MAEIDQEANAQGKRDARKAIRNGVPRWILLPDEPSAEIHSETGLPVLEIASPRELAVWQQWYTRGWNDEIMAGIKSGKVQVDFRPLLMTRPEVENAMAMDFLGTLSLDNPKIESPRGDFVIEIAKPKSKSKSKHTWISYTHESGGRRPDFGLYDGPLHVATGLDGRVLVIETEFLYLTRDVITTQVLNRYQKFGPCSMPRNL